jgi:hypothetical protein
MSDIERLTADQARVLLPGSSRCCRTPSTTAPVGFLRPLSTEIAERYWLEVSRDVAEQSRSCS